MATWKLFVINIDHQSTNLPLYSQSPHALNFLVLSPALRNGKQRIHLHKALGRSAWALRVVFLPTATFRLLGISWWKPMPFSQALLLLTAQWKTLAFGLYPLQPKLCYHLEILQCPQVQLPPPSSLGSSHLLPPLHSVLVTLVIAYAQILSLSAISSLPLSLFLKPISNHDPPAFHLFTSLTHQTPTVMLLSPQITDHFTLFCF